MKAFKWTASIVSAALFASALAYAADDVKPTDAKEGTADVKADGKMKKPAKLTKPWSRITSLTEDQEKQIRDIHAKALDEINVIEAKEKTDIMAVLNDSQKAELKALTEQDAAGRKAKMAPKPETGDAAPKDGEKPAN